MPTIDSPAAADLRALAALAEAHPELDGEVTAAIAELHIVLSASDLLTPEGVAALVLAAGGHRPDAVHADPSFDHAEVALPAGAITLNIHKMRPDGPMLPSKVAPDGPVSFTAPDPVTTLRATLDNVADELDLLFQARDQDEYSRARVALTHRLHELRRQP